MSASEPTFLACSVRACGLPLVRDGGVWRCASGHSFDVARSGYLNLLQPHDRRSLEAGDSRDTAASRRALLDGGFGLALRDALFESVDVLELSSGASVLDLGCGDGHFLAALCAHGGWSGCGIDLSAHAIESAARRHPTHTWLVANADRRLPLLDGAFELGLSIDGRRPRDEFARVLAPTGRLVVAIPAANDLIELRGAVLSEARMADGVARVASELAPHFDLSSRRTVEQSRELDRAALAQLAAATYRCARHSERAQLDRLDRLTVTTAHDLLTFTRSTQKPPIN